MVGFVPHLVDQRSGVGVQICTKDVNIDRRIDILSPFRLGTFRSINPPAGNVESLALVMREILMSHSDVSRRGFLKSAGATANAAGVFASASTLSVTATASSAATTACPNTAIRQLTRGHFHSFDYVPERPQNTRDGKLKEETVRLVKAEDTTYTCFRNGAEAMVAHDPEMYNSSANLGAAAIVTVILRTHSYHEGTIFQFDPDPITIHNGGSSLAKAGEAWSAARQKPNDSAGWSAADHGSVLEEPDHVRLTGPRIDCKEPQVYR